VAYIRNPAYILNYGGIKCYSVSWVRTRRREVAGSKYYLNKNKNKKVDLVGQGKLSACKRHRNSLASFLWPRKVSQLLRF